MSKKSTLTKKIVAKLGLGSVHEFLDCEDLSLLANDNYRAIDDSHVDKLVHSIKEAGLKTQVSLVVKVSPDGQRVCLIEDGHHRVKAVRRLRERASKTGNAWLSRPLPCRVKVVATDSEENKTAVDSVMMNQLTKEETIWDKADAYKRLREAGETTASISAMVGVDERSVRRAMSLLKIPPDVRAFAEANLDRIRTSSLYKLASALDGDGASGPGAQKSVEVLLLKKATDRSGNAGPAAMAAAKKEIMDGAAEHRWKAVEGPHLGMAAYLALDFLRSGGEEEDHRGDGEDAPAAQSTPSDEHANATEGDERRQKPKNKALPSLPRPRDPLRKGTTNGGQVERIEDKKNRWRDGLIARIAELGLPGETFEAVRAVILKS